VASHDRHLDRTQPVDRPTTQGDDAREGSPDSDAAFLAVTGFAGTAEGGVKLHYDRAHKAAVKRCGSKRAAGRNVYRSTPRWRTASEWGPGATGR
jgi:hypothetical protein